ncbi:inner centromere protein A-like isoform X3 [Mya arenaria]|uniref:inner centromere protein A-like isoform X3 n=1 Tax=Mya arenaria TaxID=6604 RepID=UPI0022E74285|nr:inner centromere protein A-like isoform X3 [Mya arenaria]
MADFLEHRLFFEDCKYIHHIVQQRVRLLDEKVFAYMDECLADARKVMCIQDQHILPKTPSMKQRSRRIRNKTKHSQDADSLEQDSKTVCKTLSTFSDDDDFESVPPLTNSEDQSGTPPTGQRTRASKRAATTSRASKTRTNKTKKKAKSQEPVCKIQDIITDEDSEVDNVGAEAVADVQTTPTNNGNVEEEEEENVEIIETWTQPAGAATLALQHRLGADLDKTPVNKPGKPINPNFCKMNVKEKVTAYEEIILISPVNVKQKKSASPVSRSSIQKTPEQAGNVPQTPETVVQIKTISVTSAEETDSTESKLKQKRPHSESGEEVIPVKSAKKDTPRLSSHRQSTRKSLRKSLHTLPSTQKLSKTTQEVEKPVRTRTRLRLKKKQEDEDPGMETDTESVASQEESRPGSPEVVAIETMEVEQDGEEAGQEEADQQTTGKRRTRSKGENSEEETEVVEVVRPVRSTRTKTRAQTQSDSEKSAASVDSAGQGGSVSSVDGESSRPRVTRTKTRQPQVTEGTVNEKEDSAFVSPASTAPRTRTKTRKRQHEEESDGEKVAKRSCVSVSSVDDNNSFSEQHMEQDDEDSLSPKCPASKVVRPQPHSFLNNLNKNSTNPIRPVNLHTGLVRSFITRSPAPKATHKETQQKKAAELRQKEERENERMKRREEEHKKKIEEMRKKREEKMRKVQSLREIQLAKEKQSRVELEKRLKEKRENGLKQREERVREEQDKQKLRQQKLEEAEERRKREETDRQRKLQEQLEQERAHEQMLARKREHEEQERQAKILQEKRRLSEKLREMEAERERDREKLLKQEEEKHKEWQQRKEERERQAAAERAEKEKQELDKKRVRELQQKREMEKVKEQERLRLAEEESVKDLQRKQEEEMKKLVEKHNNQLQTATGTAAPTAQPPKPNLNRTHSIENAAVAGNKNDSYEMTPKHNSHSASLENYCIDDLNSGDDTDDEDHPRKKIPDWAQGTHLKTQLIKQYYHPPDILNLLGTVADPDLNKLFHKKKARFNKRTSSAHWDTPILKPGLLGRS